MKVGIIKSQIAILGGDLDSLITSHGGKKENLGLYMDLFYGICDGLN